ncbi:helix-turn-helix transcriptional regulator [Nocardiopsis mangrovi]|uniref:Helix-turn-helix transcriptional regulator n=1 Tax=Nocardiopsis mangrovi TaxID=1179818 RepID=A0ABV9DYL3_9ACTN
MGDFLRSRRARIGPGDVGLPTYGTRRRVPGLRREELAHLAGVSVDYYVRLEQGRTGGVSDEVLEALARVLLLDDDERSYLFSLAKPVRRARPSRRTVTPHLRFLLDTMRANPAYVLDHRTDILAWNPLATRLILDFGALPPERRNWVRLAFEDPRAEAIFPDWAGKASETVAHLRMQAALHPGDARLSGLVAEMSRTSERFREMWDDHNVRERSRGAIRIRNDVVGEVSLHFQTLKVAGEAAQWLVAYAAEPGSAAEKALRALAVWSPDDDGPAHGGGSGSA